MAWSESHDLHFLEEMMSEEPWRVAHGTTHRSRSWGNIARRLNERTEAPLFHVDVRAVRSRFAVLKRHFFRQDTEERRASGISPPLRCDKDRLLEEAIALFDDSQRQRAEDRTAAEAEHAEALEVREIAMRRTRKESFDSVENLPENCEEPPPRQRRITGIEATYKFLTDKLERNHTIRSEGMDRMERIATDGLSLLRDYLETQRRQQENSINGMSLLRENLEARRLQYEQAMTLMRKMHEDHQKRMQQIISDQHEMVKIFTEMTKSLKKD